MDANPFDQFDTPTATPPVVSSNAPPATSSAPPQNPFDQFDTAASSSSAQPSIAVHAQPQDDELSAGAPITITASRHPTAAQTAPQGYTLHGDFADTMERHANPLPPDVEKNVVNILSTHPLDTAAADARAYLAPLGIYPTASTDPNSKDNFDQVIDYRRKHGTVSDSVVTQLMAPEQAAKVEGVGTDASTATVRGAGDALSAALVTHADSALHALADTVTGNAPNGFANDFSNWENVNQSILKGDEANHPYARLVGQLIGGMALPTGTEGAALEAGKSVLVAGGTMREARAAAASAARSRIASEGAAYGAVHGAATSDNPGVGAVTGADMGAAAGYALAAGGQALGLGGKSAIPAATEGAPESSAPDYVQLARDLNVRRTPATNSRTGTATVVQAGLDALPGGGPIGTAAARETEDLGTAARNVAESAGPVSDRQGAGEAVAQGASQYKAASKAQAKGLYGQRDQLIGGPDTAVPTPNAASAIQDIASRFPTSPAIQQLREHPAIRAIGGALPGEPTSENVPTGILDASGNPITRTVTSGGEPLTLGEVTEALSHVRGVVRNLESQTLNGKATAPVLSRVKQVEQGLENDVMQSARNADVQAGRTPGDPGSAVAAQRDADAFYADRAQALNGALKRPLQSAADDTKVSGESVYNQVSGDMDAQSGNLSRLRETWFRLPQEAKSTFAATKIDDLGRALPGQQNDLGNAWSFQTFLTNLNKLSPQARNIVFGGKADEQLQKIATYANRLRQLDKFRNFSNSAKKYFAGAFIATVGHALMQGDIHSAVEGAAGMMGAWGGAKLLMATPAMRDWTASALKAAADGNENAAGVLTNRLSSLAASQPTLASEINGLKQSILSAANDNIGGRVAASPNANAPQQKKSGQAVAP